MKSVLISIQPQWCKMILKCIGWESQRPLYKKRLELRKTAPKTPFKAYIYCTKGKNKNDELWIAHRGNNYLANGKVIAEFTCNYVLDHCEMSNADMAEQMSCVPREDILKYANGKNVRGWHIDNLVIYDKPRALSEFVVEGDCSCEDCNKCKWFDKGNGYNVEDDCRLPYEYNLKTVKPLKRLPQSWCYVEDLRKEDEGK